MPSTLEREEAQTQKRRVQLDFSDEAFETLLSLKRAIGASTNAEVIRHGLALLQWAVEETQQGKSIIVEGDNKDVRKIVLPFTVRKSR